jgi:hypothetical protein
VQRLAQTRSLVGVADHVGYLAGLARLKFRLVGVSVGLLILVVALVVLAGVVLYAGGHGTRA